MYTTLPSNTIESELDTPEFDDLVDTAVECYVVAGASHREIIRQKFRLGGIVSETIKTGKYGEGAIKKLAEKISSKIMKRVDPKRLYEAARLYDTFEGNIERIWELDRQWNFQITYSFLVRQCIPAITAENAYNEEELRLRIESELSNMEKNACKIESRLPELEKISKAIDADISAPNDSVATTPITDAQPNEDKADAMFANDIGLHVDGFREAVHQTPEMSRIVLRSKLRDFSKWLKSMSSRSVYLTQKDIDLINEIIDSLTHINNTVTLSTKE